MEITSQMREIKSGLNTQLRLKGLIPAELYGRGVANLHLSVTKKEFKKIFKQGGETSLVMLIVGAEKRPVFIHDVSYDPISDEVTSVDFYQVKLDEKIKVKVPIRTKGEAPALKIGGVLVRAMQEIEVEALPQEIPHEIFVDLSELSEIGKSIRVSNLDIPKGAKIFIDVQTVVVSVTAKITDEQEAAMRAEGAAIETVKVEVEEKKAERDEKAAAAAPATEEKKK